MKSSFIELYPNVVRLEEIPEFNISFKETHKLSMKSFLLLIAVEEVLLLIKIKDELELKTTEFSLHIREYSSSLRNKLLLTLYRYGRSIFLSI